MWKRNLEPRCANWLMYDVKTRRVQTLLESISIEDKLSAQTMAHIKHLLGGIFRFAIAQGIYPAGQSTQ